jgi:phage/plasmid-like protein (TIGR03299 family)
MSHALESMFSGQNASPWHGLGHVVEGSPSIEEGIVLAGLDWKVETHPIFLADGRQAPGKAVIRETDKSILGVVGPRFEPLQNAEAFSWFQPFIESGQAKLATAGSLHKGKRVWVLAELNRPAAEIADGDVVKKFLLLSNSHDGSLAVRVGFTPIRVVCQNTLSMAHSNQGSSLLRLRHTKSLVQTLAEVRDVIDAANQAFEATAEQYRALARSKVVNREDLRKYVKQVLKLTEDKEGKLTSRSAETLAAVMSNFDSGRGNNLPSVRGTWWAAYNAVTEHLSWGRGRTKEARLDSLWFGDSARVNREALEQASAFALAV